MDALDVAILREMGIQPYGAIPRPPETVKAPAIAKRLGANPERVADRIARMTADGVLLGYEVYPNYRHLNLDVACFWMRFRDDAQATHALDDAAHVDGIASAFAFVGGEMNVSVCGSSPPELDRKIALLARLAGGGEWRKLYDLVTPPVRRALDHVDWRILQALRGDAFRSRQEVGDALGIAAKTVTRRLDRMAEEGAFFTIPEVEWSKVEGMVLAMIVLEAPTKAIPSLPRQARETFHDVLLTYDELVAHEGVSEAEVVVAARSMHEVDALVARAKAIPNVTNARALLLRDSREDYAWLDDAIAGRVRATKPAMP